MANSAELNGLHTLIKDYDKKISDMKKQLTNTFKNEFKVIFKQIFDAYPSVKKVGWTQYTPYFNDGDACVFRVNDLYVLDDTVDPDLEDEIYEWKYSYEEYPLIEQLASVLSSSEDILLQLFGDHVLIIATKDGIDVSEYDHD
jgi:hypothetical protein